MYGADFLLFLGPGRRAAGERTTVTHWLNAYFQRLPSNCNHISALWPVGRTRFLWNFGGYSLYSPEPTTPLMPVCVIQQNAQCLPSFNIEPSVAIAHVQSNVSPPKAYEKYHCYSNVKEECCCYLGSYSLFEIVSFSLNILHKIF